MQASERADWHKLGNMLGYVVGEDGCLYSPTTGCAMLLCGDDALPEHTREAQAMLIGLACEEANGSVQFDGQYWVCDYMDRKNAEILYSSGTRYSRPAAAIAMLEAYREERGC